MTTTEFIRSLDQAEAKKVTCLMFDVRDLVKAHYPQKLHLFDQLLRHIDDDYHDAKVR